MIQPVPASSLRLISLDNLPKAGPPPSKGGHFFTVNLDTFKKFPLDKEILVRQYRRLLERTIDDVQFYETVRVEVLTCIRDVCSNLMVLRDGASNEAEMRFAFGNPGVRMLCAIHGYYLSVEQKVNTPGITQYVSEKCAADLSATLYITNTKRSN